ncbi:MAG: pyridoxamine 5'-phosphate oxidase family protein [Clostridia bacterium]|nr:pyridoxamine 5'-phosphate oxidase family protein [Clostridia bacterium]
MFRQMRRTRQMMTPGECSKVLENGASGVLALSGDDGYPYAVPLNYAYSGGKLLFHCAVQGHKLDAIERCDKASFCVVDFEKLAPEKVTTHYRSVIAFGRVRVLTDEAEKRQAIEELSDRFIPSRPSCLNDLSAVAMLEMTIEHMTGKESMALKN